MSRKTLLLVDDDTDFLDTMAYELESFNYQVSTAKSKSEVEHFITQNPLLDYAIVDLRIGLDSGLSVISQIKKTYPDSKITMLTAFGSIASTVEAMKRGSDNYLLKPCSSEELLEALSISPDEGYHQKESANNIPPPKNDIPELYRKEREYIDYVLQMKNGNISQAAKALGIKRQSLQRKLKKFITHPKS